MPIETPGGTDQVKRPSIAELREELVDDRALQDASEDLLRHEDVVDELEQLACAIEVPANVALYGPWGSGKSSLSNLLRARLEKRGVPFARFDAFKYSEAPMRRLFLSQMARELGVTGDPAKPNEKKALKQKFESGLYTDTTFTEIDLPRADLARMVLIFLALVLLGTILIAGVLAFLAIPLNGPWAPDFKRLLLAVLPAGSIAAALIAAVASFANQTLPVDRKRSEPSSEEEFERLFRDLVAEVDTERIVIFIDELDRCSSDEVVGTLETIRTFLEVEPCVVIVAADQQVLERALRRRARQETPFDPRNPYYSSGSAYLDKIFNFQMSLPPLRSRRLSEFALALARDLGGLWKEVDIDAVLLALIPTHVRSPRRVKALLNGFVANYRLAERRVASGSLPDNNQERAAEIARLTCLQVEFPLFAADLTIDPRLPEFVLSLYLDDEARLPEYVPETVEALALRYANLELDVDEVLPGGLEENEVAILTEEEGAGNESGNNEADGDETTASEGTASRFHEVPDSKRNRAGVRSAQGQHLLDYLQRTEQVGEIGSDLIYLEGRGTTFGIDPTRAEGLENAAVNGDRRAVAEAFDQAPDARETRGMLLLLAQVAREAPLGPEAGNAIHVMLSAAASNAEVAGQSADDLLRAFWAHRRHFSLEREDLPGALVLALNGNHDGARELLEQLLSRREAEEDQDLGLALIAAGQQVLDLDPDRVGMIFGTWLDRSAVATTSILLKLSGAEKSEILAHGLDPAEERIRIRLERVASGKDADGNPADDPDEAEALAKRNESFAEALALALQDESWDVAEMLALGLLAADSKQARDLVEEHLENLPLAGWTRLKVALLNATRRRALSLWPRWLAPIQPETLDEEQAPEVEALLAKAWREAASGDPPKPKHLDSALDALQPIYEAVEVDPDSLANAVAESMMGSVLGSAPRSLDALREAANEFVARGFLGARTAADAFLSDVQSALGQPASPEPDEAANRAIVIACAYGVDGGAEILHGIFEASSASPWLPVPMRHNLMLCTAANLVDVGEEIANPLEVAQVRELSEVGQSGVPGVSAWLRSFATSSEDVLNVLEPFSSGTIPKQIEPALIKFCEREGSGEALWMAQHYFEEHGLENPPSDDFLAMLAGCQPAEEDVANWLIELSGKASKRNERAGVMAAWRGFNPRDPAVRKRLLTEVYLPLGEEHKGDFKLALRNIKLAADPPHGTKTKIKETLRRQAAKHNLRRRTEQRLESAGIDKAKLSLVDKLRPEESLD